MATTQNGRKTNKPKQSSEYFDKQPPYDLQAEVGVLGSVILMPEALDLVLAVIRAEDFYDDAHQKLLTHIAAQYEQRRLFDLTLLIDRIKAAGDYDAVGKTAYLTKVVNAVPNAAHAVYYANIVREKATYRRLIIASTATLQDAYDQSAPAADLVGQAETALAHVSDSTLRGNETHEFSAVVSDTMDLLDQRMNGTRSRLLHVGLDAFRDCMGLGPGGLTVVGGRPSMGKCLGLGTPVLMHDGTVRPVETITVGDRLMGPDSQPRLVLSTTRGRDEMYSVAQSHAMTYRANGSHILMLKRIKRAKKQQRGMIREMTIDEVRKMGASFLNHWHGYKVGVEYEYVNQPLDPYFIGLWLGDGTSANAGITTADKEIATFLKSYADRRGQHLSVRKFSRPNKAKMYVIVQRHRGASKHWSMIASLRRLNLLNNKHIPRQYLIADRQQRLKLFAGLVDSDGHYDKSSNCFEITMTDRLLTEQIKMLADGLGFRAKIKPKLARCQSGAASQAWRLRIGGHLHLVPTLLPRKRPSRVFGGAANREATTYRLTITPDCIDEYYGFTLSGDGQFLLADGTVTHNTALCVRIATNVAQDGMVVYFASLEMTATELANRMLSALARIDCYRMASGRLHQEERAQLVEAASLAANWRLCIDDSPTMTLAHIGAAARRVKRRQQRLDLVVIDYAQLVEPENRKDDRVEQLAKVSRGSKRLARELECPVILCAQVNREATTNADNRPRLHQLKGAGNFEEDADSVVFVHRPKWYAKDFPPRGVGEDAELLVEKNRNGPLGSFETLFFGAWMDWQNKASAQHHAEAQTQERETHF